MELYLHTPRTLRCVVLKYTVIKLYLHEELWTEGRVIILLKHMIRNRVWTCGLDCSVSGQQSIGGSLVALTKLSKATISFGVCVCLCVRSFALEQLGFHWRDPHDTWHVSTFRNSVEKIRVCLKSDKNMGYFTWRLMNIYGSISLSC